MRMTVTNANSDTQIEFSSHQHTWAGGVPDLHGSCPWTTANEGNWLGTFASLGLQTP